MIDYKEHLHLLACPTCKGTLAVTDVTLVCGSCGAVYTVRDGVPILLDETSRASLSAALEKYADRYDPSKKAGLFRRVYDAVYPSVDMRFVGHLPGARHDYAILRSFIDSFPREARILDLGSGTRRLDPRVVNMDIDDYPGVDVVGDATKLPLKDSSWDGVVLQMVVEHIADPFRLGEEIHRILVPGGRVFCDTPFLFHQHGEADYFRYTPKGLRAIFQDLDEVDSGCSVGPGSNIRLLLIEYFSLVFSFGVRGLRHLLSLAIAWLTLPFVWIDRFWTVTHTMTSIATTVYFVGRKR